MGKLSSATNFQCDIIPERHATLPQPEQLLPVFPSSQATSFSVPAPKRLGLGFLLKQLTA